MILQVAIVIKESQCEEILKKLAKADINGSTVINCSGSASTISDDEYLCHQPIFAGLRAIVKSNPENHKMILSILSDEQKDLAKSIVVSVLGDLSKPNSGVLFALPLLYADGIQEKK